MFSTNIGATIVSKLSAVEYVPQSDKRYSIVLLPPGQGETLWISFDKSAWHTGNGFEFASIDTPLYLCVVTHGDIVQRGLYAVTSGTKDVAASWIEAMACDCESQAMLRDALGHSAGDKDWHLQQAIKAQGGYGRGGKGAR